MGSALPTTGKTSCQCELEASDLPLRIGTGNDSTLRLPGPGGGPVVLLDILDGQPFVQPVGRDASIAVNGEALVTSRYYDPGYIHETVAGALPHYDLPDLVAALAPRPVLLVDPRDELGQPASRDEVRAVYREPWSGGLSVAYTSLGQDAWEGILAWLRRAGVPEKP